MCKAIYPHFFKGGITIQEHKTELSLKYNEGEIVTSSLNDGVKIYSFACGGYKFVIMSVTSLILRKFYRLSDEHTLYSSKKVFKQDE